QRLASYVGVDHCISVSSGTDALLVALMALGIKPGDEVITTPFTFVATAETIALLGAIPVFVDILPNTYNLDPQGIEAAVTSKTRAIIPVSLFGQCARFEEINGIARKHGLAVIEDGAQSFGATRYGKQSCGLSTIGCTSFFPSKPLGGYGDGGACFTPDGKLAERMKEIRVHGQDRRYHHPRVGVNGRLDTLQAAVLLSKFKCFQQEVDLRQSIGERYMRLLTDLPVTIPYIDAGNKSVFAQFSILVEDRDVVIAGLKEFGIPTAVHYPVPLHRQPAFKTNDQLPVAERVAKHILSLPMHPYLSHGDQDVVVEGLANVLSK
ncbi:MAG: DegT/DnrJ/EryC1/StrS family aminotransferase, partial [Desulfobacterales bacterium]|nr:DegT/DnrJ/EryC1/StrS family aminotransferase [Desulfobacterales bacterium]